MKKHYLYAGLLTLSLAMACTENIIIGDEPTSEEVKTTGVAIKFEANGNEQNINDEASKKFLADLQGVETRTQYAGEGTIAEVQGTNTQLLWSTDDPISIYQAGFSANGNTTTHTEYKIKEGGNKSAKIVATGSEMEWQADKTGFRFIATYPSVNASGNGITAVNFDNTSNNPQDYTNNVSVTIKPQSNQTCVLSENTLTDNNTVWHLARPDMKNSLMIGADTKLSSGFVPENEDVKLAFDPIMSTLMIAVGGPYNTTTYLKGVKIYLKDNNGNAVNFAESYTLQYQLTDGKAICNKIKSQSGEVPYYYINLNKPIKLGAIENKNHNCLVTAFLPPHVISKGKQQLQIVPEFVESDAEGAALNDWYISSTIGRKDDSYFTPSTKMVVNTGRLMKKFDNAKWMSYIPDNVYIKDLSIPGAHNALNVDVTRWSEAVRSNTQVADITQMLNAGIRALDISLGVKSGSTAGNRYGRSYYDDANNTVYFSGNTQGGIKAIQDFLKKNPTETVLVLLSFDSDYSAYRDASWSAGASQVIDPLMNNQVSWGSNGNKSGIVYFNKDLTMGEARGKVILFVKNKFDAGTQPNYFDGFKKTESGTNNLRYTGICFLPNVRSVDFYYGIDDYGSNKTDKYLDLFQPNATYYSYKVYDPNIETSNTEAKSIGAMAFQRTKMQLFPDGKADDGDGVLYFLNKEFISKRTGNGTPPYTNKWNTTIQPNTEQTYTGDQSNILKPIVVKDFLNMAADNKFIENWFMTIVPGWSGFDDADDYTGAGNFNDPGDKGLPNYSNTNTWASNYLETHKPILQYLQEKQGQGRKGIVYFDFVPGRNENGEYSYKYTTVGYNDMNIGTRDNKITEEKKNVGKEMTRLLIQDNLMRTLRRKPTSSAQ